MDKYLESVKFIESLINLPGPNYLKKDSKQDRSFFIKRLKYLLKLLGNPQNNFQYIHVAGTSGKSSLACMIQSMLTEAGAKTGAYFSPHPTTTAERIKVGHGCISPADFSKLTDYLKPYLSKCVEKNPYGVTSYFETLLALALLYFKQQKCKYVVLETGLGGKFDATNIISKSELAIITKIDLDHTDVLGNTKQKIARDKAGIIKKGSTLITAEQDPKILQILKKVCKEKKCQFKKVDFDYRILRNDLNGTKFEYQGDMYETKLPGEHQVRNAMLAIEALGALVSANKELAPNPLPRKTGEPTITSLPCSDKDELGMAGRLRRGLLNAFLPCRLEAIQKNPTVIIDGAHNPDKMKSTADFLKNINYGKLHLILALAENKDLYNTLKYVVPLAARIYLTRFLIPGRKSQDLKKMLGAAKKLSQHQTVSLIDPYQALNQALREAKKNDIVLVTGSFFLAGELRKKWITEKKILSSNYLK